MTSDEQTKWLGGARFDDVQARMLELQNSNMSNETQVTVIGGGLAGSEAAWQAAERGVKVRLYEMRPARPTPAHKSANLGEIVCSNSLEIG